MRLPMMASLFGFLAKVSGVLANHDAIKAAR